MSSSDFLIFLAQHPEAYSLLVVCQAHRVCYSWTGGDGKFNVLIVIVIVIVVPGLHHGR
jgi:hypothetical protein